MFNIPMTVKPALILDNVASSSTIQRSSSTSERRSEGIVPLKGQKVSLTKLNPNLQNIEIGLGWDVSHNSENYDLDGEVFLLGANDKVIGDNWFVFYNQPTSPDGSVAHHGDNRGGSCMGDKEVISIKLNQVSDKVVKLVFVITIDNALQKGQNFSGVRNAYMRIIDKSENKELVKFNLTEYYASVTSMVVGELYLKGNEWRFNPVGDGTSDDLLGLCVRYGVNVS